MLGAQHSEIAGFSLRWLNCSFDIACLCITSSFYTLAAVTVGHCARSYYQTAVGSVFYKKDFTLFQLEERLLETTVSFKGNFANNFVMTLIVSKGGLSP